MGISGLVIGEDVTTAILGALNAGYFGGYLWGAQPHNAPRRRVVIGYRRDN